MDPLENEQDDRLAQQIKGSVLAMISSQYESGVKGWKRRYAKAALVAAAVVLFVCVAGLLASLVPWRGTKPTLPVNTSLPTQPTTETDVKPTSTTIRPTWPVEMLVPVDQYQQDLASYKAPQPGHVLITLPVRRAIDDPANQDRIFFVAIGVLSPEFYANLVDNYLYNGRTIAEWHELVDLSNGTYPYSEYNGDHGGNVTREDWIKAQAEARTLDAQVNCDAAIQEYREKVEPQIGKAQAQATDSEMERLTKLGYDVFAYTTWSYSGAQKSKEYFSVKAALLTKDQLLNFPTLINYGYYIDWVHCGDGVVNWQG
jgi:hypothetical protein